MSQEAESTGTGAPTHDCTDDIIVDMSTRFSLALDPAFIASNNYISNADFPFGRGVPVSYDASIAESECAPGVSGGRRAPVYSILIPSRDFLLHSDDLLEHQPPMLLTNLFSHDAIQILFYDDYHLYYDGLQPLAEGMPDEERYPFISEKLNRFCDGKREFLMKFSTVAQLVEYITSCAPRNNKDVTSWFLHKFGVKGTLFGDGSGEHVVIYDARGDIAVTEAPDTLIGKFRTVKSIA